MSNATTSSGRSCGREEIRQRRQRCWASAAARCIGGSSVSIWRPRFPAGASRQSCDMHSEAARQESVLVVDDETGIRDLMSRWLKAIGFSVKTAANAEDALQVLRSRPAAVALCDINMPGRDGLWLADRIRHEHPDTAIIMATALTDVDPAVESLRSGAVDYLTKPFGRDRLREAVTKGVE